jgi:hypothetical protein
MPRKPTEKQLREERQRQQALDDRAQLRAQLDRWEAGRWAEEVGYGPACTCGLRGSDTTCLRHPEGRQDRYPLGREPVSIETPIGEVGESRGIRHYCPKCGTVRRALRGIAHWEVPPHHKANADTGKWEPCEGGLIDYEKDKAP